MGALLQNLECHAVVVRDAKVHVVSLGECMQKSDHAMINYLGVSETLSI